MKLEPFGRFLEQRSKPVLAVVALVVIASIVGIVRVDIDTRFSLFAPSDSAYSNADELMKEAFGDGRQLLLLVPIDGSAESLRHTGRLARSLSDLGDVSRVIGPIPPDMADATDEEIFEHVRMQPALEGFAAIVERDSGTWTVLRVQISSDGDARSAVAEIAGIVERTAPGTVISGEPYLETQMFDYILKILIFLPPLALLLMLGVFRLRIGNLRATMLSMVPAGIGAVVTLGALSWVQGTISVMSVLVPIFVIVLGSADGLHVTSHVMDQLGEGRSNKQAIINTLEAVGVPIIITSLTTMAGFLSLMVIGSPAIREMAVTAAAGMLVAGLVTWVVLPILLFHQKPLPPRKHGESGGLSEVIWRLRGWPSVVLAALILIAAIPGALRLTADFSMVDMYKARTEVRRSIDTVSEVTGGAFLLAVLTGPFDPFDEAAAHRILEMQARMHDQGLTTSELSIYSLVSAASQKVMGGTQYPESPALAKFIAGQIEKTVPELYATLVADAGWIKILLYVSDLDTSRLKLIAEIVGDTADTSGVELYPTGSAFEIMDMNLVIIPQQLKSMGLALVLVVALTAVSLRSAVAGIKAAIPIALTLVGLYAAMGYVGIDLSVVTSIMSGLTIGVGIDYAIHYTSIFQLLKKRGIAEPAHRAMSFVATPVLANAIGLSVGFTVMIFSPMQIHTTLSILMWVTMVLSAVLSLSLLPTLLGARQKQ
jgi:uncharacterized protein